jgi:hypothetical protein
MMRKPAVRPALCLAVLTALIVFAGMQVAQVSAQTRNMPVFELDRAWPKVPPQWRLGDPSSIGIDAQDNIWVLQRPRTLKPEQAKMTAPAIVVFDGAGNFIKAWGGDGSGFDWPQR